jgi:hypothetical protein
MGPLGCPIRSVTDHQSTLLTVPGDGRSGLRSSVEGAGIDTMINYRRLLVFIFLKAPFLCFVYACVSLIYTVFYLYTLSFAIT